MPFQYGIEVIGPVRSFMGPQKTDSDDIPKDNFQRLAVFLVKGQKECREHDDHHHHSCGTAANGTPEQKEKRYAKKRPAAKADTLSFSEIEKYL